MGSRARLHAPSAALGAGLTDFPFCFVRSHTALTGDRGTANVWPSPTFREPEVLVPGVKISSKIRRELPLGETLGISEYLWAQSGGQCYLCGRQMNVATEDVVADHVIAAEQGGETTRANLKLTHTQCNSFKKNYPTLSVTPFLRLRAFFQDKENVVRYADALEHFGFEPVRSVIEGDIAAGNILKWHFPQNVLTKSVVLVDRDGRGDEYLYTFVEVPRDAIFNDDDCQPRTIKLQQILAIYNDLQVNPLHEPPSCRLHSDGSSDGVGLSAKLLMFDGQHKSIASWMHGKERLSVKIYLDMDRDRTIQLVNSIQSRIKKLPLSSFEHALKFSEEWSSRLLQYEDAVGTDETSEQGLIDWLKPAERQRAKSAAQAALIRQIIDDDDIIFSAL